MTPMAMLAAAGAKAAKRTRSAPTTVGLHELRARLTGHSLTAASRQSPVAANRGVHCCLAPVAATTNTLMAATTLRPFESMQDLEKEMARRRMTTPTPPPIKGELLQEQQAQRRFLRSRGKDGYQVPATRPPAGSQAWMHAGYGRDRRKRVAVPQTHVNAAVAVKGKDVVRVSRQPSDVKDNRNYWPCQIKTNEPSGERGVSE